MTNSARLNQLPKGQTARVIGIHTKDMDLEEGLREQGFIPGSMVEVLEKGLIGGTPISVRVGRAIIAVRAREAAAVEVGNP